MINSITLDNDTNTGHETFTRDKINNFDNFILEKLPASSVEDYAEFSLGMVNEDDCECESADFSDLPDYLLEYEVGSRGFIMYKPSSIVESQIIEKFFESLKST